MIEPYYQDETITLYQGDAWELSRTLDDESINAIVTSPPYWKQRDYGTPGQWGQEETIGQYVDRLTYMFATLKDKLTDDGVLWINLGDKRLDGQLVGAPWMVAKALQDDGWRLITELIWHKPNGMPESVQDRVSVQHEHVFMLTKNRDHHFNLDPLRVVYDGDRSPSRRARSGNANKSNTAKGKWSGQHEGRNPGSVWSISTQPFSGAHTAPMPEVLAMKLVESACPPAGVVLDPFHGSGTTGAAAQRLGRKYVGFEISSDYLELSLTTRLKDAVLPF